MATLWPEKSPAAKNDRRRVIQELANGRDLAIQLKTLLHNPRGGDGSRSADELLLEILRSFSESLSALSSCELSEISEDVPDILGVLNGFDHEQGSENCGESKKRPGLKDGRGCYKRSKGTDTRKIVSPTTEDGYAWRKYGQKDILNAKYPRCYYRCTHKHDQDCRATKQVQRTEDNLSLYQITYIGHHTCRETLGAPQMITDLDPCESYIICNSDSKHQIRRQSFAFRSSPPPAGPIKKEEEAHPHKEDTTTTSSDLTDNVSSRDSILPPELMGFDSSSEPTPMSMFASHGFFDMDFMSRGGFDGGFPFLENEFS